MVSADDFRAWVKIKEARSYELGDSKGDVEDLLGPWLQWSRGDVVPEHVTDVINGYFSDKQSRDDVVDMIGLMMVSDDDYIKLNFFEEFVLVNAYQRGILEEVLIAKKSKIVELVHHAIYREEFPLIDAAQKCDIVRGWIELDFMRETEWYKTCQKMRWLFCNESNSDKSK